MEKKAVGEDLTYSEPKQVNLKLLCTENQIRASHAVAARMMVEHMEYKHGVQGDAGKGKASK